MSLCGVETGRHQDEVWVELPTDGHHEGTEHGQVLSISEVGHCVHLSDNTHYKVIVVLHSNMITAWSFAIIKNKA